MRDAPAGVPLCAEVEARAGCSGSLRSRRWRGERRRAVAVSCDWWLGEHHCACPCAIALRVSAGRVALSGFRHGFRVTLSTSRETRANTSGFPTRASRGRTTSVPTAARPCTTCSIRRPTLWRCLSVRSLTLVFHRLTSRSGSRANTHGWCRPRALSTPSDVQRDPTWPAEPTGLGPAHGTAPLCARTAGAVAISIRIPKRLRLTAVTERVRMPHWHYLRDCVLLEVLALGGPQRRYR